MKPCVLAWECKLFHSAAINSSRLMPRINLHFENRSRTRLASCIWWTATGITWFL